MDKPIFHRIRAARTSEAVARQLQDGDFFRAFRAGDRLPSERVLAEQFGVSRISVRDALRSLESSGLVEIKVGSNGGAFVREQDFDPLRGTISSMIRTGKANILELVEARKIIETVVVQLAAQRATQEDLRAMRAAIDAARRSSEAGDYNYGPHSIAIHAALARAAENR